MKRVQDLLHTQTNVNENNTNNDQSSEQSILFKEQIPNTPFTIVGHEETGYFIAMGKYRLTQPTQTIEESYNQIETMDWNLIMNVIIAATNQIIDNKNNKK